MPIEKWSDSVLLVHLTNEPVFSDDLQTIEEQLAARRIDAVLDMSAVKYINSSHIARLLHLRKVMQAANARLVLCSIDANVWSTFLVTGLDKVFETTENVPTSLATLQMTKT